MKFLADDALQAGLGRTIVALSCFSYHRAGTAKHLDPYRQRVQKPLSPLHMTWIVYILECTDGSLYTGITNNMERRLKAHANGRGAKYTKRRGPFTVRYTESLESKGAALQREAAIKALDRSAKVLLCSTDCKQGGSG